MTHKWIWRLAFLLAACGSGACGSAGFSRTTTTRGTALPPDMSPDLAARCTQPGVIRCVGFDRAADIAGGYGDRSGIFSGVTTPALDMGVKASGNSSLKFTIPSNSAADTSGSYFTSFSDDLSAQFGENQEFYVQWRQRFSPELLATRYKGGGWKQAIIGTGDKRDGAWAASCTALTIVIQNVYHRGFTQMYNSCTGSASHGPYDAFEETLGSDVRFQNARPSPYCLYSAVQKGAQFPPAGNCFGYFPNEWMTFQIGVRTGPRLNDEFAKSYVTLWIARENQPSEMVVNWGPYNLTAGSIASDDKFGKVWLLPYNTDKDSSQTHPAAYTWYDELIISRNQIADPGSSSSTGR